MITVEVDIEAPIGMVWECWTLPEHITKWNFASDEWCCPSATNELKSGGEFVWRMEAKDGSMGFDFKGVYDLIDHGKSISYKMDNGRKVVINFSTKDHKTRVIESFETEGTNTDEQQRAGWQAILENLKKYVESK